MWDRLQVLIIGPFQGHNVPLFASSLALPRAGGFGIALSGVVVGLHSGADLNQVIQGQEENPLYIIALVFWHVRCFLKPGASALGLDAKSCAKAHRVEHRGPTLLAQHES